ncbi:MAG: mevalonate kinase [Canibacter sp.]
MNELPYTAHTRREGWGIGRAYGKTILIGEHSVVHGAPAIAVPLYDLGVEATIDTAEPGFLDSDIYTGPISRAPKRLGPPLAALQHATEHFGIDINQIRLRVRSTIPYERGLGSSAAVATAITRACASFVNESLSKQELFELVQAAERVAHGTPSGLDAHTVSASSALRFHNGVVTPLEVSRAFTLVIADTGKPGRTSLAVSHVRDLLEQEPVRVRAAIDHLATLTSQVQTALAEGDTNSLGEAMNAAHETLATLEVSAPELDHLVRVARDAGAVGAKMTGGGMGGCVIALVPNSEVAYSVATRLRTSGASRAWISSLASVTTGSVPIKEIR